MFPSQGFFAQVNCPEYGQQCWRPFCHFHHNQNSKSRRKRRDAHGLSARPISSNFNESSSSSQVTDKEGISCIDKNDEKEELEEPDDFDDLRQLTIDEMAEDTDQEDAPHNLQDMIDDETINETDKNIQTSSHSDAIQNVTTDPIDQETLIHQLVTEAVKKVLAESPLLSSSTLDANSFLKKMDPKAVISKAVEEISSIQAPQTTSTKEKKLYLPPPGIPSYNPTPISKLRHKGEKVAAPKDNLNVYVPSKVSTNLPGGHSDKEQTDELTDFSSDEETPNHEFDILEELIAEQSSNPLRTKAIKKRKKEFSKLKPLISGVGETQSKCKNQKEKEQSETSSNDKDKPQSNAEITKDKNDIPETTTDDQLSNPELEKKLGIFEKDSSGEIIDNVANNEPPNTHNLLPKIAQLTRPSTKEWVPVAKHSPVAKQSFSSIEKMLEKFDAAYTCNKNIQNNSNVLTKASNISAIPSISLPIPLDEEKNDKMDENSSEEKEDEISNNFSNDSAKSSLIEAKHKKSNKQKRSCSNSSCPSPDRKKRRKMEDRSRSRSSKKKKKRRYSYSDVSYDSYGESDSKREVDDKRKHRDKKSKYKKRQHSHRRKHKKRRRKGSRSYHGSGSSADSVDSVRRPKRRSSKHKLPIDLSDIKQERIEIDLTIVKDEEEEDTKPVLPIISPEKETPKLSCNNMKPILNEKDGNSITQKRRSSDEVEKNKISKTNSSESPKILVKANAAIVKSSDASILPLHKDSHTMKTSVSKNMNDDKIPSTKQDSEALKLDAVKVSSKSLEECTKGVSKKRNSTSESSEVGGMPKPKVLTEVSLFSDLNNSQKVSRRKSSDKNNINKHTDINTKDTASSSSSGNHAKKSRSSSSTEETLNKHDKDKSSKRDDKHSHQHKKSDHKKESRHTDKHKNERKTHSSSDKVEKKSASSKHCHKSHSSRSKERRHSSSKRSKEDSKKEELSTVKVAPANEAPVHAPSAAEEKDSNGNGSPIPDLSALDEITSEEWDQLLCAGETADSSCDVDPDGADGVDAEPSSTIFEDNDASSDMDDANDPEVMKECLKVFSEYQPRETATITATKKSTSKRNLEDEDAAEFVQKNKRIAYDGASGNLASKPSHSSRLQKKTPGQIMLERYQKLKEEEVALQRRLEQQRKEWQKYVKDDPPPPPLAPKCISSSSVSSTSGAGVGASPLAAKKRIARVPSGTSAFDLAIDRRRKFSRGNAAAVSSSSQDAPSPTPAVTVAKGAKRTSHTPKLGTLSRPIVASDDHSKVPQTIRQRYLNCFVDETLKFCNGEQHAFDAALAEEKVCYNRATTRMVYLNVAVNTLKRLRSKTLSDAAREDLAIASDAQAAAAAAAAPASYEAEPAAKRFAHPLNPNHKVVSHFSVLAVGGQKGSWSIQKTKKKVPPNIDDIATGTKFYNYLKKYILKEEILEENGFPRPDPSEKGKAIIKKVNTRKKISPSESQRYCARCHVLYSVDEWGLPLKATPGPCVYHWGRPYKQRGFGGGLETRYSCCQSESSADGCCQGSTHVSDNYSPHALRGFVRTLPKDLGPDGEFGVYALDCEMCYTTHGNELTRITVIGSDNRTVYETLVRPDNPIIDYNTRFSGITAEDMEGVNVSLREVQAALLTRFSQRTILMGHSLESDFNALKFVHDTVVDTSVVFPHRLGPPYKRALRNLASEYLQKIIQNDVSGHDSAEDAVTCLELMKWKIKEDLKGY